MTIRKVAVLGSGVMGSGIAAQVANAGVPVVLLDIVPQGANDRSQLAKAAIERMGKTDPAPLMSPRAAKLITPGNFEDDMGQLADVDWIVEAVLERPDVKHDIYQKIDAIRKDGSIVSSNTSTIPLNILVEGQSDRFKRDFIVTHFFNPPRYMRLLELVAGKETRADAVETVREFCDVRLGKGVVVAHDTPGFIANRIGQYWMTAASNAAVEHGLTVEEADALAGRPLGMPRTGVFGLMDLVGIDLMPHIMSSMLRTLPQNDDFRRIYKELPIFKTMLDKGLTGRKSKSGGGFFRLQKGEDGRRTKQAIDLQTGDYRAEQKPTLASIEAGRKSIRALIETGDKGSTFVWEALSQTLLYAIGLVPEIADSVADVDAAMRTGYNWGFGPFELIDRVGAEWFVQKARSEGRTIPPLLEKAAGRPFYRVEDGRREVLDLNGEYQPLKRPEGVLLLSDIKLASKPVARNGSASLWDIGEGVLCLEFTSKMNALDADIIGMVGQAIKTIGKGEGQYKALVIHNEGENFSVGANLGLAIFAINVALWPEIESSVNAGQQAMKAMKYAPFPIVSAPAGMALGGGCEVLLHSSHIQAHAETYIGLVEVGVGVIPGWGGCKEMIQRHLANKRRPGGPIPPVAMAFETIGTAKVSRSAEEARDLLFLRPTDGVTMNRDRLLADAKKKALELVASGYKAPEPPKEIRLPGPTAVAAVQTQLDLFAATGKASKHDLTVGRTLATVLSGGADGDITKPLTEDDLLRLEREAFVSLTKTPQTIARIEHMLTTGKPLRN